KIQGRGPGSVTRKAVRLLREANADALVAEAFEMLERQSEIVSAVHVHPVKRGGKQASANGDASQPLPIQQHAPGGIGDNNALDPPAIDDLRDAAHIEPRFFEPYFLDLVTELMEAPASPFEIRREESVTAPRILFPVGIQPDDR